MTPSLLPPVSPYRGLRMIDSFGAGGYGAPRGGHQHQGLDFVSLAGDPIIAPCTGVISHVGVAYPNADLGSVHLDAPGLRLKLLYLRPGADCIVGAAISAGGILGSAQSVAGYWMAQRPGQGMMINHCHLELRLGDPGLADPGQIVDPTPYILFPTEAA